MKKLVVGRRRCVCACCIAAALAIAAVSPASAQQLRDRATQEQSAPALNGENPRDQALHDCNMDAGKYGMSTWQSTQLDVYGECMAEHNQPP
jgi:hypothetical protein